MNRVCTRCEREIFTAVDECPYCHAPAREVVPGECHDKTGADEAERLKEPANTTRWHASLIGWLVSVFPGKIFRWAILFLVLLTPAVLLFSAIFNSGYWAEELSKFSNLPTELCRTLVLVHDKNKCLDWLLKACIFSFLSGYLAQHPNFLQPQDLPIKLLDTA